MTELGPETLRTVDLTIMGEGRFKATNVRGGVLPIGQGDDPDFTPVELLLAALAGCGAIDLEWVTEKRAPFASFAARAEGHKVRDEQRQPPRPPVGDPRRHVPRGGGRRPGPRGRAPDAEADRGPAVHGRAHRGAR